MIKKHEIAINKIYEQDLSFYREFIDQMKVPVLLTDENGSFVYANRAAQLLTGYSDDELKDMTFNDLFKSDIEDPFVALKTMGNIECKIKMRHQENADIAVRIKIYNFRPNDKRKHYYQIILRDFYIDKNLNDIRKPLESLADKLSEFNDKLEQHIKGILEDAGLNTTNDK